ncbi:MAG: prepilin peptidase [Actinomycetaceae bacterium]
MGTEAVQREPGRRARATAFGAVGPVSVAVAVVAAVATLVALFDVEPAPALVPGQGTARALWALAGAWLAGVGILLAVTDQRTHRLPDKLLVGGAVVVVPLLVVSALVGGTPEVLLRAVMGAVVPAGVLYVVALVSPGGVGLGDVKLLLLTGVWLGYLSTAAATLGPVLGIVVGGLVSLVAVVTRRADLRSHVPLGPSLVVGTGLATWLELAGGLAG